VGWTSTRGITRLQFHNGAIRTESYTEAKRTGPKTVPILFMKSRDGSVWTGTLNGGVSKFRDGRFTTYTMTNGLASNAVSSILETAMVQCGLPRRAPEFFSNGQWRTYTTLEGLPSLEDQLPFRGFILEFSGVERLAVLPFLPLTVFGSLVNRPTFCANK